MTETALIPHIARSLLMFALGVGAWFPVAAAAQLALSSEVKSYLQNRGNITMCVDPDWMPYEEIDAQGKHIGIAADFIAAFANLLDKPIELVLTESWSQSLEYSKSRKCDILSLLNESEVRWVQRSPCCLRVIHIS